MPVQLPSLQSMLKRNVPDPSTKNGRRSGKNVSKASRLTTAGSASTWPKSGFAVAVSVRPGVTAYFRSRPSEPPGSGESVSGSATSTWRVSTLPSEYGISSKRFGAPDIFRPRSSPNCDTNPLALRDSSGQVDVSARRPTSRMIEKPTGPPEVLLKRSCENGMRNSARQPSASFSTSTSHTASQLSSLWPSLK